MISIEDQDLNQKNKQNLKKKSGLKNKDYIIDNLLCQRGFDQLFKPIMVKEQAIKS